MDDKNVKGDSLLCGLVLESAATFGTNESVKDAIEEACNFNIDETPSEAKEESHPLACEITIENAGVPTGTMAEILKDECGSDT